MTDATRNLIIKLYSHMTYMQGQLEAHHELDDLEDYYWYRESVALRQQVADALATDEPAVPEGREPASVVGEPSDELVAQWIKESDEELKYVYWKAFQESSMCSAEASWLAGLRAVARWGNQFRDARKMVSPALAAEGEVAELVALIRQIALAWEPDACLLGNMTAGQLARAADLLEQRHPAPVPVSERLPGPGDCDAEGRCWLLTVEDEYPQWRLHSIEGSQPGGSTMIWVPVDSSPGVMVDAFYTSHWLPFHALPLPQGESQP